MNNLFMGEDYFQVLEKSDIQSDTSEENMDITKNGKQAPLMSNNASPTIKSANVNIY